jgi:hypothetical protein
LRPRTHLEADRARNRRNRQRTDERPQKASERVSGSRLRVKLSRCVLGDWPRSERASRGVEYALSVGLGRGKAASRLPQN